MRILRIDGTGGASGDMLLGALAGLGVELDRLETLLRQFLSEHFHLRLTPHATHGVHGHQLQVDLHDHHHDHGHDHDHEHHHHEDAHRHGRTWADIRALLLAAPLTAAVRDDALAVFDALAQAEGAVHGVAPEAVHFHEVGATDSIIDIVGACWARHELGIDAIDVAPLATGSGTFRCAHGVYPIPAPATVELLRRGGLAIEPCDEPFELLTPTGAALLTTWPRTALPVGARLIASANSFGQRELHHRPNWLRATLYDSAAAAEPGRGALIELACNLDDCTGEMLADAQEKLWAAGARDVWTTAIGMKKNRPGVLLSVLTDPEQAPTMCRIIFERTTTFGIREYPVLRHELEREFETCDTPYGPVAVKLGRLAGRIITRHPEFAEVERCAATHAVSVKEVLAAIHHS